MKFKDLDKVHTIQTCAIRGSDFPYITEHQLRIRRAMQENSDLRYMEQIQDDWKDEKFTYLRTIFTPKDNIG